VSLDFLFAFGSGCVMGGIVLGAALVLWLWGRSRRRVRPGTVHDVPPPRHVDPPQEEGFS